MSVQVTTPKPSCSYSLPHGEKCKRSVANAGDRCWQHSRGLRQHWSALVGNKTILFVLTILGVGIGFISLAPWILPMNREKNPLHVTLFPAKPTNHKLPPMPL